MVMNPMESNHQKKKQKIKGGAPRIYKWDYNL